MRELAWQLEIMCGVWLWTDGRTRGAKYVDLLDEHDQDVEGLPQDFRCGHNGRADRPLERWATGCVRLPLPMHLPPRAPTRTARRVCIASPC